MGLDMYLDKYPKMKDLKPRNIDAVDEFCTWIKDGLEHSFETWCGYSKKDMPDMKTTFKLIGMRHTSFYAWDNGKEWPHESISDQVGYWRKANAIHSWFVDNVQDGEDDCEYHRPVTKDDLEILFELCREVLIDHSKANELLPYRQGFFFGSYEYDEWYFKDIQHTADLCKELIDTFDFDHYDLYYRSSW